MSEQNNALHSRAATVKGNDIATAFVGWYILSNGWEVFLTQPFDEDGYASAYVMGFEDEFGSVSLAEHQKYIVSSVFNEAFCQAVDNGELAPPIGGSWVKDAAAA